MAGVLDWAARLWHALTPESHEAEPVVTVLDDWRTEFAWRGPVLTVDRRRRVLLRNGRVLAALHEIRSIDVIHLREDDDAPERWRVGLGTGFFTGETLGTTQIDVEAPIAAARLATVRDVKVRAL